MDEIISKIYGQIFADNERQSVLGKALVLVLFFIVTGMGTITWSKLASGLVMSVFNAFFRTPIPPRYFGAWAVVTGCTDGIGLAIARRLAAKGMHLVLVSRNNSKLEDVAAKLRELYGIRTETVAIDFAESGEASDRGFQELTRVISRCDGGVGVLVNNAGVSYDHAEYFDQLDQTQINSMIQVNVSSLTRVTKTVLPAMLRRKRGCVVNIGSGSATIVPADPLYSVYAGTKAYVEALTRGLAAEYAGTGVRFQLVAPLLVATRMSRIRKPSLSVPSADSFAFFVMRRLGRELVTAGHPAHSFMWWVIGSMPERLFLGLRTPTVKDIRRRALEKKTRLGEGVGGGGERRGERGGAEGTAGGRGTGPGLD